MNSVRVEALVAFYETLSRQSVAQISRFYAENAYFKDPFNEVRGVAAIARIFNHMFEQVDEPRFSIGERLVDGDGVLLVWVFSFRPRGWGRGATQVVRGATHLKFDADGRVVWHRDYWDVAEELYAKLPLIGGPMRWLQKKLSSA